MQFKVPQNIDMEDKIIGPLTLTQFFYLLFGGLILYILFNKLVLTGYSFFFFILAVPIGLASFASAFVKVQDRPFPVFVLSAFKYFSKPRQRIWHHADTAEAIPVKKVKPVEDKTVQHKQIDRTRIEELAHTIDQK